MHISREASAGVPHHEYGNRADIGVFVRKLCDPGDCGSGKYFSYEESLAVAVLILHDWPLESSASIVNAGLVYAVPYVEDYDRAIPERCNPDGGMQLTTVELSDGTVWWIVAENALCGTKQGTIVGTSTYRLNATRGLEVVDVDILKRVRECISKSS